MEIIIIFVLDTQTMKIMHTFTLGGSIMLSKGNCFC